MQEADRASCAGWCRSTSQEGKSYLTIAIGCTGGRHRSVYVAEALKRELSDLKGVSTTVGIATW